MTKGASAIAINMKIKPFIVGLTIVAMGTSAPELCVSLSSAIESATSNNPGLGDIAIGNVVGSNIFNNLLIVGCVALIAPLSVKKSTVKRDIPITVFASVLLLLMLLDAKLSWWEGAILLALFVAYMAITIKNAKNGEPVDTEDIKPMKSWKAISLIIVGLAILIYSSDLFVDFASEIAKALDVSEKIIGLTIVGCGTSAPELATSIMAARKGEGEMAIGNVIGSNIFNIFMIIGASGVIQELEGLTVNTFDLGVLIVAALLFLVFSFTKYKLERWERVVMLAVCIGYISFLIASN